MRTLLIILSFLSVCAYAHNIAPEDQQELEKLTLDYTKWNGTGVPEDFWKKLDIQSLEETRKLIIESAIRVSKLGNASHNPLFHKRLTPYFDANVQMV